VLSVYDHAGNPHYGGGGAVVVARVAARLAREYEVTVYCGSYRGSRSGERDGVRYVFLPVGWAGPRAGQVLFQLLLPLVALARRPAVWIESLTPPLSASLLPLVARFPVVGLVQMLCGADMQRRYGLPFEAIERRGLTLYRHFVVLNEIDGDLVRGASPRASVTVIPNGVDVPAVVQGADSSVLFLGRVDVRQKGLDLLLAAVAQVPEVELVVAGSGTPQEEARLRELVPDAARHRIRLVGRVDGEAKDRLLRDCAFMVVPSRYETFCLTALEAMAHGRPVVHFDLERLGWIGTDCGIAVPAFDVDALRDAIATLASDAPRRARLGEQARARSADFDWDAVGDRYAALVARLLGGRPQRRSRLRRAESRSLAGSGSRSTSEVRNPATDTTAARWAAPIRRLGKTCIRICSRVPLARSALYASFSPSRSSSVTPGSAKA
jgi:glycosyltransferase involved in cell wall biosynthesis